MTIQHIGAQSGENGTGSTTVSVNAIAGVQQDDLIFAIVSINEGNSGDISPTSGPSGFTELIYQRANDTYPGVTLWVKTATSSEPSSYQWTLPFSNKHTVSISAYRNAAIWGTASGSGGSSTLLGHALPPNRPLPNMWLVGGGALAASATISASDGNLRSWATSSGGGPGTGKLAGWIVDKVYPLATSGTAMYVSSNTNDWYSTAAIWIASTVDSYGTISASGPIATDSIDYFPPINVTDFGQGGTEDLTPKPWKFFHDSFPDDVEWTTFTFDTMQIGSYEGEGYMHLVTGLANGQLQKHRHSEHYMYQNDWIGGPVQYFVTISATGGYANGLYRYPSPSRGGWMERVTGVDTTSRYLVSATGIQDDTGGTTSGHAAVYDLSPDGEGALWYTGSSSINNERRISFRRTTVSKSSMVLAPTTAPFTRTSLLTGYWVTINAGGGTVTTRSITYYKATEINAALNPQTFTQSGPHTTASDKWFLGYNTSELFSLSEDIVVTFSHHLSEIEFDPDTSEANVRTYGVSSAYSEVDFYQINATDFWYVAECNMPYAAWMVRKLYRNESGEWTIGPECIIWSLSDDYYDWWPSFTSLAVGTSSTVTPVTGLYSEKGRTFNNYDYMPIGFRVRNKNLLWSIPLEIAKTYTPQLTDGAHYGGVAPSGNTYISVPRAKVIGQKTLSTTGTQLIYTFPQITEDCIVIAFVHGYPSSTTWTFSGPTWTNIDSMSPGNSAMQAWYRVATVADSLSSLTVTCSNAHFVAHLIVVTGIDLDDPIHELKEYEYYTTTSQTLRDRIESDSSGATTLFLSGNGTKSPSAKFLVSFFAQWSGNYQFSPEYMGIGELSDVGSFVESGFYAKSRVWAGGASVTKRPSTWVHEQPINNFWEIGVSLNEVVTARNDLSTSWNYTGKVFGPIHPEYYPVGTFPPAGTTTPGAQDYSATIYEWHYDSVPVNSDLEILHDVIALESVGADIEFVWDLQGAVNKDVEILFDTIAETLSAARSLDILWNDLVPIGRSREFPWGVLTTVGSSLELLHGIGTFANSDLSIPFNVGGAVSSDLVLRHSIGVFVNRSLTIPWAINLIAPPRDLSVAWHVTRELPQYASFPGGVSTTHGTKPMDADSRRRNQREEQKVVT